jgi:hypothetical protein
LGPFHYEWSTGQTGTSIVVRPKKETTYSVTVRDALGQTETVSVTVLIGEADATPGKPSPDGDGQPTDQDEPNEPNEPPDGEPNEPPDGGDANDGSQDEPPPAFSGLCPVFGLSSIGLTLLGLWWARSIRPRGPRRSA